MYPCQHTACMKCLPKLKQLQSILRHSYRQAHSGSVRKWPSRDVRKAFLDFFCQKNNHQFVKSSSVIPAKNEGTYFTNAGMNQFKPIFLGTAPAISDLSSYRRVANSQKCVRVGGKHNDLSDVGRDYTHHTFFEMLGSWSFGDYFKKESCSMALDLLVNVYNLPLNRLYFTYFGGNKQLGLQADLECREIWRDLGVPENQILPFDMTDNFWDMGETGPCGPCTEIHYDHIGNRNASHLVNTDNPEVVEIWNLVFMQYNRLSTDKLVPLPSTHVDTGMGLERLTAVLQGTRSNYNTDLFLPIFDVIQKETGIPVYTDKTGTEDATHLDTAYRIIADHTRMATVCISDGLLPGRDQLQHKLRHVIYAALNQCHQLMEASPGLLGKLVAPIQDSLGEAYPEINIHAEKVKEILDSTEDRYLKSMEDGMKNFNKMLSKNQGMETLLEPDIRRLHDGYYGHLMSTDMIEIIARDYCLHIDPAEMEKFHKATQSVTPTTIEEVKYPCYTAELLHTLHNQHIGRTHDEDKYNYQRKSDGSYEYPVLEGTIQCLIDDNNRTVQQLSTGDEVGLILDQTVFYSEKGGQVGDRGLIKTQTGTVSVQDTQSSHDMVLHVGMVTEGYIESGQTVTMEIDTEHRLGCMRNHTATHLLNSALHQVVGSDVTQCGSTVNNNKLSFDFSSWKSVSQDDVKKIEDFVITLINSKLPVQRTLTPFKEAVERQELIYLDNVIYPPEVYVVSIDDRSHSTRSVELCGGTHVLNTGDIEDFCITSLQGQTAGTKSVTCVTGQQATQAKLRATEVESMITDFQKSVNDLEQLGRCIHLHKQITVILGTEVLPKSYKDEMVSKFDKLGTDLNIAINKQAFINLKKDLTKRMNNEEPYVVHEFVMKVLPKLNKMIKTLTVKKPLILVVTTSNNTVAYIAMPKGSEAIRDEIVSRFCESVSGHIKQTEANYQLVSVKGNQTQLLLKCAEQIFQDRFMKEENLETF